jgi:hypothetical protein
MAKLIWVYTLDVTGITGLKDFAGTVVGNPQPGMLYTIEEGNSEIADDGSKKLYHSANGILDPMALDAVHKTFHKPHVPVKPSGLAKPTADAITATGATINWTTPTGGDPVTSYEVAVTQGGTAISGSPFTMAASTHKKVLTGLTAATAYKVKVKAINGAGNVESAELTVTTTA